jgi:hypothetical protein
MIGNRRNQGLPVETVFRKHLFQGIHQGIGVLLGENDGRLELEHVVQGAVGADQKTDIAFMRLQM